MSHTTDGVNMEQNWHEGSINLNGDLLTMIRHELASCEEFKEEYHEVVSDTVEANRTSSKRGFDGASPEGAYKKKPK